MNQLPKHLQPGGVNHDKLLKLESFALKLKHLYWQPIYLVGSSLAEANEKPRDWDIRIEMPNDEFEIKFGNAFDWHQEGSTGQWTQIRLRWSDECTKRTKEAWRETGLNVDFQIYPELICSKYATHRKYQLGLISN